MTDQEMAKKLTELAQYYASGGLSKDNPMLVDEAMQIGRQLNDRGGTSEMLRIFHMIPAMQGKRTEDMTWNGIGNWRG